MIGGVIRNLANNEPVRDIDMIYTNINALELIKNKSDYTSNRLGGTKIKLKKINVDLWPLAENWATKKGLIDTKYALTKELAKGTFFNFDSLVYSINSNVLKCELYNECLKKKELDIIIHDSRYMYQNPTREANIVRAFYLQEKYDLSFSKKLIYYIQENIRYFFYTEEDVFKLFDSVLKKYPKYRNVITTTLLKKYVKSHLKP
ncbi:MAG: hypothetical protein E6H08_08420 [Bacteroidetes bacterium]|nr:MAG: hypothetical protein E6H08_08420 [Bacteroidota bacterium]